MMTSNLIDIFVRVFNDLFAYLDINHKFMSEVPESSLNSTEKVNTLVGISGDMEGNIMFGYNEKVAKAIAAKMMGAEKTEELDIYAKAAITDFFSDFCKRVNSLIRTENLYSFKEGGRDYVLLSTNPTFISGENMYGIISKVASKKLFFKVDGEKFGIAYSLEQK